MPIIKPLLTLFILILLFGCSNNRDDIRFVASEKSLPSNFDEIAVKTEGVPHFQYLVNKVVNQTQYKEVWSLFDLKQQIPKVNFEENDIYFIGVHESGSCPYELEEIKIVIDNQTLNIDLSEPDGACTSDATPRTFVIEVNKKVSRDLKNVIIVQSGAETTIPVDGN